MATKPLTRIDVKQGVYARHGGGDCVEATWAEDELLPERVGECVEVRWWTITEGRELVSKFDEKCEWFDNTSLDLEEQDREVDKLRRCNVGFFKDFIEEFLNQWPLVEELVEVLAGRFFIRPLIPSQLRVEHRTVVLSYPVDRLNRSATGFRSVHVQQQLTQSNMCIGYIIHALWT